MGDRQRRFRREIQIERSAGVKAPAPPGAMLLHPRDYLLAPRLTFGAAAGFQGCEEPARKVLGGRDRDASSIIRNFRIEQGSRVPSAVRARIWLTADGAGHRSGCEFAMEAGQHTERQPGFAFGKT